MAINKFQRSRFAFDLSAKIVHTGVWSIYLKIVFSQTFCPIKLKFHVKATYDKLAKPFAKLFGHMAKMTATPIYGKNPLKSSSPELEDL